jgi:hypothetical protein
VASDCHKLPKVLESEEQVPLEPASPERSGDWYLEGMAIVEAPKQGQGEATRLPTIKDVAELAGVATSTVSRALSNPDRVNRRTHQGTYRRGGCPA